MWKCFSKQCCGSVINYCGSDFGFRFRFRFLQLRFRIQTLFSTVFQQQQKYVRNLAFLMSEAALFPKSSPFFFDFLLFYYILCWMRILIRFPEPYCVPVPVLQMQKSYGSCGSGSTTPAWRARFNIYVTMMALYLIFTVGTLANIIRFLSEFYHIFLLPFVLLFPDSRLIPPFPCWEQTRSPT